MQEEDCIKVMNKIWVRGDGKSVSATGAFGGVLTWWDTNSFKLLSTTENHHCIFVELEDFHG